MLKEVVLGSYMLSLANRVYPVLLVLALRQIQFTLYEHRQALAHQKQLKLQAEIMYVHVWRNVL